MATNISIPCDPCKYSDDTRYVIKWPTECFEGLCKDCSEAHQTTPIIRDHKVISIQDHIELQCVQIDLIVQNTLRN